MLLPFKANGRSRGAVTLGRTGPAMKVDRLMMMDISEPSNRAGKVGPDVSMSCVVCPVYRLPLCWPIIL